MIPKWTHFIAGTALFCAAGAVSASLIESWEYQMPPEGRSVGPWELPDGRNSPVNIFPSELHVTEGAHSLAINCTGGWQRAAVTRSGTLLTKDATSLRHILAEGSAIEMDVFCDRSLWWAKISVALLGNDLEWTLVESRLLRIGGNTTV
ncbi:MAG TPA: hypothetical protein PKI32_08265, partial [Opitutales bacterium]|nr:hypothetical protein [Opitutales bacterium]